MDRLITRKPCAGYGAVDVLQEIDLRVGQGELMLLLEANGAGKSTFLKTLAGLIAPSSREIILEDWNIQYKPALQIVERGLDLVPEGRQVFPGLTVAQNIQLGAYKRKEQPDAIEL